MKKFITIILSLATIITMLCTPVYSKSFELVAQKTVTLGENEVDALSVYCTKGEKVKFEIKQNTAMDYVVKKEYTSFVRTGNPQKNQKVTLALSSNDSYGKHWCDTRIKNLKKGITKTWNLNVRKTGTYTLAVRNITDIPYDYKLYKKPQFTIKIYKK